MGKANLNKIPKGVLLKLGKISSQQVVVSCRKTYNSEDIKRGALAHLGISLNDKELLAADNVVPPAVSGKYSDWNVNGKEVIRKDLPKETHYRTIESPNWGDASNGTHDVNLPYEKYPRDFNPPDFYRIKIEVSSKSAGLNVYLFRFEVEEVLDKDETNFGSQLLRCLNLLQENVGCCGVEAAGTDLSAYAKTVEISWEILPPGTREEALMRISRGRSLSTEEKTRITERYDFFKSLNPIKEIYGSSGWLRYFGALLRDDLVVFEHMEFGNALYVMYEDWALLSRRTRLELLSGKYGDSFERVIHASGWKGKVREIIRQKLHSGPAK